MRKWLVWLVCLFLATPVYAAEITADDLYAANAPEALLQTAGVIGYTGIYYTSDEDSDAVETTYIVEATEGGLNVSHETGTDSAFYYLDGNCFLLYGGTEAYTVLLYGSTYEDAVSLYTRDHPIPQSVLAETPVAEDDGYTLAHAEPFDAESAAQYAYWDCAAGDLLHTVCRFDGDKRLIDIEYRLERSDGSVSRIAATAAIYGERIAVPEAIRALQAATSRHTVTLIGPSERQSYAVADGSLLAVSLSSEWNVFTDEARTREWDYRETGALRDDLTLYIGENS